MARPKDRAERMAIVAEMERKEKTKRMGKNLLIGVIVIAVVAAAGYGIYKLPSPPKQVHWHAKYQVWVDDSQLNFNNPALNGASLNYGGQLYLPAHLHSPSDIIHNEGKEGEGTMGKFFLYDLGGKLTNTEIDIPAIVPGAAPGPHLADANHTISMFLDQTPYTDQLNGTSNWHQVSDPANQPFHDGDRILLLYGNDTAAQIAQYEKQFPTFDPKTIT